MNIKPVAIKEEIVRSWIRSILNPNKRPEQKEKK